MGPKTSHWGPEVSANGCLLPAFTALPHRGKQLSVPDCGLRQNLVPFLRSGNKTNEYGMATFWLSSPKKNSFFNSSKESDAHVFFLTRMAPCCWNGWKREVQLMQTDTAIPYANWKQPSRIADVACCQKGLFCCKTMPVLMWQKFARIFCSTSDGKFSINPPTALTCRPAISMCLGH